MNSVSRRVNYPNGDENQKFFVFGSTLFNNILDEFWFVLNLAIYFYKILFQISQDQCLAIPQNHSRIGFLDGAAQHGMRYIRLIFIIPKFIYRNNGL